MTGVRERRLWHPGSVRKRDKNDMMRDALETWDASRAISFFCECPNPHCHQPVWLTITDYDKARTDPAWTVVASAHDEARASTVMTSRTRLQVTPTSQSDRALARRFVALRLTETPPDGQRREGTRGAQIKTPGLR